MIKTQCKINSKVLEVLLDIVQEKAIPMNINVGKRHKHYNGGELIDILYEYEEKDKGIVNEAMCQAINVSFDLVDNQ